MPARYAILYHPRTLHEQNYRYYYIPFSLVSVASTLDPLLECLFYDNNVKRYRAFEIGDFPDVSEWALVGISSMIGSQIDDGLRFADFVRSVAPECPIVWGGACPTMLPELVLEEAPADYVVIGPGEETIKELWLSISTMGDKENIAGLAFRNESSTYVRTGPRYLPDLDTLPSYRDFYHRVGVENYIRADEHIGTRTVNYHSSQGCVFNCGFCCEPALWNRRWAAFSAHRIVDDLRPLVEDYGINGIKFYDSEFFIRSSRALEFADLLLKGGYDIRWAASIHPKNLLRLNEDKLALLRRSGLSRLLLGAESAVQEELNLIQKKLEPEMVLEVSRRCAAAGISASFTFVTGYPGFPTEHIDRTLEFAEELVSSSLLHEAKVHFYGPYPGTPLYNLALENGFQPPSTLRQWANYDYYYIQTPWVPEEYFKKVRQFNEEYYPYLPGSGARDKLRASK